ncbi:MAG TPA: hypothetical protein P5513_04035 [Candidatus Diapherotrites archaeon]|nr:hypothetical protein [Candidatus Diapherotrites archaeon]
MNNGIKIYIASPYKHGNKLDNVLFQINAFNILRDLGYLPMIPLLSHYIDMVKSRPQEDWLEYDMEILKMCDMVVRLRPKDSSGKEIPSEGSDMEEAKAKELKIPYFEFETLEQMEYFFKTNEFEL